MAATESPSAETPHGEIGEACASCHTQDSWDQLREPLEFDHSSTGFELLQGHEQLACRGCHESLIFSAVPTACADCHEDPHAGDLGSGCESCHTADSWDNRRLVFDYHSATLFPLTGAHAATDCSSCHRDKPPFEFSSTPTECVACHLSEFEASTQPNHARVGFSTECQDCHTTGSWHDSRFAGGPDFDHSIFFVLEGAHRASSCGSCHRGEVFAGTPRDCFSCHQANYDATVAPPHATSGFATSCESCHEESGWEGATFDHDAVFELAGAHLSADCESCHVGGQYLGTARDCASCHAADYEATTNPNHVSAGFSTSCEDCHTESTWLGATFDHDSVFALAGAHLAVDCESCHVGGQYSGTPRDCFSCHQADYQSTTDPNHDAAGFPTSCETCHDESTWSGATFDHDALFELVGAHRSVDCASCHIAGQYSGTPRDCFSCHQSDYESTVDPDHGASGFGTSCEACHTQSSWEGAEFEHDAVFELLGAHSTADCAACHTGGQYSGTPRDCFSCHAEDYESTSDPDHAESAFATSCEDCHDVFDWRNAVLDHDSFYPLTGSHRALQCESCHAGGYEDTPIHCYSCHSNDYNATEDPNHSAAGFPTDCEGCHDTSKWSNASFDHDSWTLTGAHAAASCESCHASGFEGTPTDCYACHAEDYDQTSEPNHREAGFPVTCEECHNTSDWGGGAFDHDELFELVGGHSGLECESCHADGFEGTPTDCYACHTEDYDGTTDPDHRDSGFSTTCEDCHDIFDWHNAAIDHDEFYPLTGAHRALQCESCHADGYDGTPTDCFSCHANDYNQTEDPNHSAAGFPTDCEDCHTTSNWNATFDHEAWPLTGSHNGLSCESCHADGYDRTPTDCYACHASDYDRTSDPDHQEAGFPTSCEDCHNTSDWDDATFDHDDFYPLTGAHTSASCESCHADGYDGTPTDCFACHADDYDRTTDPNHEDAAFPTSCDDCHTTTNWDATFDHDAFYPLTGAHRSLDCESCHAEGYDGTPTDCFSCHANDYNQTEDPNHSAAGFPTTCEDCHTTSNWDATFDHDAFYPLTGAHRNLDCESCHADGYDGTPTDCFSCHADDYNATNDPDHQAAGFPTSCEDCHTTSDWDDATFDHDGMYFPIYSGAHKDKWDDCAECHVVPSNFAVFECILCHEHRQSEADDEHDEVPGYVYDSQACYSCHPDGRD